jgi:hypothetical protein
LAPAFFWYAPSKNSSLRQWRFYEELGLISVTALGYREMVRNASITGRQVSFPTLNGPMNSEFDGIDTAEIAQNWGGELTIS